MSKKLRIVLAQLNLTVGDITGNYTKHLQAAEHARDKLKADIILFPELSITGYPPEDLLQRPSFLNAAQEAIEKLTKNVKGIYCVVGYPMQISQELFNACVVINNGHQLLSYAKKNLPNYGVFDEARYFVSGNTCAITYVNGVAVGILICEDLWKEAPLKQLAQQGAECILVLNASPFEVNKHERRLELLVARAKKYHLPIAYVNYVAGQDELIFDGGSMAVNAAGELCQFAGFFQENLFPVEISFATSPQIASSKINIPNKEERIYNSLVFALRDYVEKNNFPSVILGVSGGIDSALTLAIAVDALGSDKVRAVFMPSRYTAEISSQDTQALLKNLGIKFEVISIEPIYQSCLNVLSETFANKKPDVTEENLQARCRALILMALSNKFGHLVLTTGNRSEIAVGYCTLYGDMAGGFGVLKDTPKTLVYQLAEYRNKVNPVIPKSIIVRPPTAELAPNQTDQDSLPPYSVLDKILELYLFESLSVEEIVKNGFDKELVQKIIHLIHRSEYKRYQAALGPRINYKSFGKDWRYPITSKFKS